MKKWGRARQKLFEALLALAGSERLRIRLTYAAVSLIQLKPEDFPSRSRQRFKDLKALLTQTPLSSKIRYEAREITPAQAKRAAKEIVSLYVEVSGGLWCAHRQHKEHHSRPRCVPVDSKPWLAAFLLRTPSLTIWLECQTQRSCSLRPRLQR